MMRTIMYALATGFWSGYSPKAPGTATSLLTVFVLWFWAPLTGWVFVVGIFALALFGVWCSGWVERDAKKHDPGFITIDEVVGQAIAFCWIPLNWKTAMLGLALFRIFDIWKPGPIRRLGHLPGGWGVMADDWLAGLVANLILQALLLWM